MSFQNTWLRTPELLILALAVSIAVAASSAVALFSDRMSRALEDQSGEAFGADAALRSRDPLPPALHEQLAALPVRQAQLVQFPSVALAGENTALVSVKAVDDGYPLRGQLRSAGEPFGPERAEQQGPYAGELWADQRLWQELQLQAGGEIHLGQSHFRVTRLLTYEPDRGGGFSDLAPRVMMNLDDLAATGLVAEGSRVQYSRLLAGSEQAIASVRALPLPPGVRLQTPQEGRPELGNALSRAKQFLDVAVLAAMLLAGAAIAAAAHQHGRKLRDEAALYRALGATSRNIALRSLLRLLRIALLAGAFGLALGFGAQALVAQIAAGLMQAALPSPDPLAALWSPGLALLLVFGFAAPVFLSVRHTPPVRVFQRNVPESGARASALVAALAGAALVGLHVQDFKLAGIVLAGAAATALVLGLVAYGLVRLLTRLRRGAGTALRFGLANIARRRFASVAQAVALGLTLLALLIVSVVRSDLLDSWRHRLPPDTPNQFLINVQTSQIDALRAFFSERGYPELKLWPMTRARLTGLNGVPVSEESFDDPETRRWINREFNLSWTDVFGDDNRLIEGAWWPANTRGEPWLSVDDYAVERLKLKIGDRLKLQVADREIELRVYNVRKVSWDSFRPNFFLVTPPGVLEGGAVQWLTSFYLPPAQRSLLRELIVAFPNVTALDLDAAMAQVRGIMERVVSAVEFILLFTLAAGLTVLLAAIEGTRAERARETALLRTLGASHRTVGLGLVTEYAVLGLVAGTVAAAAAQGVGWALARFVFEVDYGFNMALWLLGGFGGAALVATLGWLSLRRTLSTPPRQVLAALP